MDCSPLLKEKSKKVGLKLNIQKTKILAFNPITSWQIDGEKMETVTDLFFLNFKITVDSNCSYEIKRHLLLGRKSMPILDSILKNRDITLLTKAHLVKALTLCDPMNCSMPGLSVHHQLPQFTQTDVH